MLLSTPLIAFVPNRCIRTEAHRSLLARSRSKQLLTRAGPVEKFVTGPFKEGKKNSAMQQAGDYDRQAIQARIQQITTDNEVVVFSWRSCPFCVKAKNLLTELGAEFEAFELDQSTPEGKAIRAELGQMTNRTSMPNCFIGGKSYGGCNDGPGLQTLHKEGKLISMLKGVGAL